MDEAIKQLSFVNKKGAGFVKEAILEAQDLAVKEHNVEFKSNLWIGKLIKFLKNNSLSLYPFPTLCGASTTLYK